MKQNSLVDISNLVANISQSAKLSGLESNIKKLQQSQNQIQQNNSQIAKMQSQLVGFQNEQIEIQKQTLLQQQIQTQIQIQAAQQREKLKELKNTLFAIKTSLDKALSFDNTLVKLIHIEFIQKEITSNNVSYSDFEDFNDKEYAQKIIEDVNTNRQTVFSKLTDEELLDLNTIINSDENIATKTNELKKIKDEKSKIEQDILFEKFKRNNTFFKTKEQKKAKAQFMKVLIAFGVSFALSVIVAGIKVTWLLKIFSSISGILFFVLTIMGLITIVRLFQRGEMERQISNSDENSPLLDSEINDMQSEINNLRNKLKATLNKYPELHFLN